MILYCFICCFRNKNKIKNIHKMMESLNYYHYIIILGFSKTLFNPKKHLLLLKCNDTYEGLSNKVVEMFKFIYKNPFLNSYSYFYKIDDDLNINKFIDYKKLSGNYFGNIQNYEGKRDWHLGKCSKGSIWNTKLYNGQFIPWCKGGYGYILSKKALEIVAKYDKCYKDEIYEDLLIAKILADSNITPEKDNI